MNICVNVMTDCASIAVFDQKVVNEYQGDDLDEFEFESIQGVQDRLFFGFSLGGDGIFNVRITDGKLTLDERDYAAGRLEGLGLKIDSGRACIGGYGFQQDDSGYESFQIRPGFYSVNVYEILWDVSPRWCCEEDEVSQDAPADFVVIVRSVSDIAEISSLEPLSEMQLETLYLPFIDESPFIFDSTTRRIGTEAGMILTSKVIKSPKAPKGFYLKGCGIEQYKADLGSYEGLNWGDRVKFRVLSIDRENELFIGELIEKLSPET